jgi:galactokinase
VEFTHQDVLVKFRERFNAEPLLIRAPGRINLIGEHTDYNDGFVMPAAIDYGTFFALTPAADGRSEVFALLYNEAYPIALEDEIKPVKNPGWVNYLLGIIYQFKLRGHTLKPFKCVFGGNIPIGSGLSSSASLECGFAFALNELNQLDIDKKTLILMAQWSEHNFAGVKCGIMDQFASMMGREGCVILLDCRSLEYSYSPLRLEDYSIVLCDTKVKHALVDSDYNRRRNECERGVQILRKHYPAVSSLRDATLAMLNKHEAEFQGKEFNRCKYVIEEIERVRQANNDLQRNNLKSYGEKMFETHKGLAELYEVSCDELNFFVSLAQEHHGVIGARMMGGGFGGCTINIVESASVKDFADTIKNSYKLTFNLEAAIYQVKISDGVSVMNSREVQETIL